MKLKYDFFNLAATEVRAKFFPNEDHGTTENKHYHQATYILECFSNGFYQYDELLKRLPRICKCSNTEIKDIIDKYIEVSTIKGIISL